jgi:acetyl-CoA synthetase (ADP-forming)
LFSKVEKEKRKSLLENEAKSICVEYGIPVTKFKLAVSEADALVFAEDIGYPVVLKIVSPDIVHKSELGGVAVGLENADQLRNAYQKILASVRKNKPDARIAGLLVEEMSPPSTEVIVGSHTDSQFGPTLMFGLGGIFVELLKDVTFRIAPITKSEATEMISEVKAYPLLKGYRNTPAVDIASLVEILLNVSRLVTEQPRIAEVDLNPILVYATGAKVVDARIILQ